MTFQENIEIFLSLVDEYAPTDSEIYQKYVQGNTEDDDIKLKLWSLYAPAYQDVGNIKTRKKIVEIDHTSTGQDGYTKYTMPEHKTINKITAKDANNTRITGDFYTEGETDLYVKSDETAKFVIEYEPWLTLITKDTPDDFNFDTDGIDPDVQMLIPYRVASDLFKTDPSQSWEAFEKAYQLMRDNILSHGEKGIQANVTEGVD